MSDPNVPSGPDGHDRADGPLDGAIRDLVAKAGADAPTAPAFEHLGRRSSPTSIDGHRRRRRIAAGGAVGLSAAAATVLFVVGVGDDGGDSVILPATPSTVDETTPTTTPPPATSVDPTPTTTIAPPPTTTAAAVIDTEVDAETSTTTEPVVTIDPDVPDGELPFGFTPVLPFGIEDDGYRLDFAVSSDSGSGGLPLGFVEYSNDDPTRPRMEIVIAETGPDADAELESSGASTFDAAGRMVYDVSPQGECSELGCTLYVRWDDSTGVSISYVGGVNVAGDEILLPSDGGRQDLLETVDRLQTFELSPGSPWFRPVVLPFAPTVAEQAVVTADAGGVFAYRTVPDGQLLLDTPSSNAVGLPDGRVIVETGVPSTGLPGDLVIVSPLGQVEPFWIDGVPDDGSTRVSIQDASSSDGEQIVLFVTSPGGCLLGCPQTLQAAAVPWVDGTIATSLRTVQELRFGGEGPVRVDLRGDVILGLEQQLETKNLVAGTLSGDDEDFSRLVASPFETQYSESEVLIALDDSGYSVESANGVITIRDHVGDGFAEIGIAGQLSVGMNGEPIGPQAIEPTLVRNGPQVLGSVWVRSFDPEVEAFVWIEFGVDGSELARIVVDGGAFDDAATGSLRASNR